MADPVFACHLALLPGFGGPVDLTQACPNEKKETLGKQVVSLLPGVLLLKGMR
jgi:hypothetical protein